MADAHTNRIDPSWVPAGWQLEQPMQWPDIVHIERPGGGAVSVDMKQRVWTCGIQLPRSFPDGVDRVYVGRGWKRQMVHDACEWLKDVFADPKGVRACPWPDCPHGAECVHARASGVEGPTDA